MLQKSVDYYVLSVDLLIVKWNKNDFFYLIFFYYCSHRLILSFQISFSRTVFWNCQDLSRGLDIYRRLFHPGDLTQPLPCYHIIFSRFPSVADQYWMSSCVFFFFIIILNFGVFYINIVLPYYLGDSLFLFCLHDFGQTLHVSSDIFCPEILGRIATSRWNNKSLNKCL